MKVVDIDSWDDFPGKIQNIENEFGFFEISGKKLKNRILYRGQSNSDWLLESTLERYSSSKWSVESYTKLLKRLVPQLESLTDQRWTFGKSNDWEEEKRLPCDELWAYLRHCGFPSPLIDWTVSPYIAAFFAFEQDIKTSKVAIFAYIDAPRRSKSYWAGSPHISVRGVHEKTHKRHFLQQSYYTICTLEENGSHIFSSHENVFSSTQSNSKRQDALIKIIIPTLERKRALIALDKMNINSFSLFQSDESLMKTLAFREIDLKSNPLRVVGPDEEV